MKTFILFVCVFAFFWVEANADCPPFNDPQEETVPEGKTFDKNCVQYTCKDGGYFATGCSESRCQNQTGSTDYNFSLSFPECCPQPICPEN
ncbi:uncharacterized protein LOC141534224 [Cotesia typhae]|uniref:uncharacterized protein LOC141534224 n=1 Tax=Cotesia typhae TaxID=2053667 RepID=UPI003D68E406